jgi:hypothetical protein
VLEIVDVGFNASPQKAQSTETVTVIRSRNTIRRKAKSGGRSGEQYKRIKRERYEATCRR